MWLFNSRRRFIVGRDDQRVFRRAHILAGDFADAFLPVADLMYPALAVEIADSLAHFAPRKLLHGFFQTPGLSAG